MKYQNILKSVLLILFTFSVSAVLPCLANESAADAQIQSSKRLKKQFRRGKSPKASKQQKRLQRQTEAEKPHVAMPTEPEKGATTPSEVDASQPQLPPLYVETEDFINRHAVAFGVQTQGRSTLHVRLEKESNEVETINRIGVGGEVRIPLSSQRIDDFFAKTRQVILFIPKKVAAGVGFLANGVKHLIF